MVKKKRRIKGKKGKNALAESLTPTTCMQSRVCSTSPVRQNYESSQREEINEHQPYINSLIRLTALFFSQF